MSEGNGHARPRLGAEVSLNVPENVRLHGATAKVVKLEDWGAHVSTPAAATGRFRAAWSEMDPLIVLPTGEYCKECGGSRLVRTGSCVTCQDCGANGGCG